jgi:hypothetical protein
MDNGGYAQLEGKSTETRGKCSNQQKDGLEPVVKHAENTTR